MNKVSKIELLHLIETLIVETDVQTPPCETGLYCPYYNDSNPDEYCTSGACNEGMMEYIIELVTK